MRPCARRRRWPAMARGGARDRGKWSGGGLHVAAHREHELPVLLPPIVYCLLNRLPVLRSKCGVLLDGDIPGHLRERAQATLLLTRMLDATRRRRRRGEDWKEDPERDGRVESHAQLAAQLFFGLV